ncbi:hypothetical protein [Pontibacter pamirensis]|uniref:hypothetical protein n=1 Tax=Pontibacter pamirensis TaxID=2562824 RepID=UPI0013893D15|nr:hypothetical protein [Pontibacter pamirensis]
MQSFLKYIALFLLLLFCRAMVPDALLLDLHPHTHTVHTDHTDMHEAQVGLKHKHCSVEDMFGKPYQGSFPPFVLKPIIHRATYAVRYTGTWHSATHTSTFLRGPPSA